MLYGALRAVSGVALHWYYGDVLVQGREHVPARGPLLIVANHPNALVDAMLVATTVPRRVLITAKATLFEHPLLAPLLRAVGVVPLRRAGDERRAAAAAASARTTASGPARERNDGTFRLVIDALRRDGVVMVFPEGISHDAPALAPIKTGAARMALDAHAAGVCGVHILPLGLVYERKEQLRSRILVRVGVPLDVDAWWAAHGETDIATLTSEIDRRLRAVTLNFASADRAERAVRVARALAATIHEPPALGQPRTLVVEAELAARVERATSALPGAPPELAAQADALVARFTLLEAQLAARGASVDHAGISASTSGGVRFIVREGSLALVATPIALLGRLTHWLPLAIARGIALRSIADDPSRDQPAMRTIVLGLGALLLWYAVTVIVVGHWFGPVAALAAVILLLASARVAVLFGDRLRRARERARTYLAFRSDPDFQAIILAEMQALLDAAQALETALEEEPA